MYLSEDEGISSHRDTDADVTKMTLLTQTAHIGLTVHTVPAVPVVHKFRRDPNELTNRNLTLLKTVPNLAFSCSCV